MKSIQGEFSNKGAAQKAKTALVTAGIPESRMRIWNIIPDMTSDRSDSDRGVVQGALIGGALGGAAGLGAGAAIGAAWDKSSAASPSLPGPSGVHLVVDIDPQQIGDNAPDIAALLRQAGAVNIREKAP